MSRSGARYGLLTLAALACGDAPTAPNATPETILVSLVGLGSTDAGVVLQLSGAAEHIEPAAAELEVAWVRDATNVATVAIVGSLSDSAAVLVVRRRAGAGPLRAEVREIARAGGALSATPSARPILHTVVAP